MGMMGKGNHKGCPYGGWMGWWSSNVFVSVGGRFPNRPYGEEWRWGMTGGWCGGCVSVQVGTMAGEILCGSNGGRDGSPHLRGQREVEGNHKGCPYGGRMGWWSSNPFVSLGGRFPNRPYRKSGLDGG